MKRRTHYEVEREFTSGWCDWGSFDTLREARAEAARNYDARVVRVTETRTVVRAAVRGGGGRKKNA